MVTGTVWQVEDLLRLVDGDTVRLVRSRTTRFDSLELTVRDADPDGASIRLVWLDTPERGQAGYEEATADLAEWVNAAPGPLTVVCYDGGAGWDRLLGDLLDADGKSASQHMMAVKGWPPYVGRAR